MGEINTDKLFSTAIINALGDQFSHLQWTIQAMTDEPGFTSSTLVRRIVSDDALIRCRAEKGLGPSLPFPPPSQPLPQRKKRGIESPAQSAGVLITQSISVFYSAGRWRGALSKRLAWHNAWPPTDHRVAGQAPRTDERRPHTLPAQLRNPPTWVRHRAQSTTPCLPPSSSTEFWFEVRSGAVRATLQAPSQKVRLRRSDNIINGSQIPYRTRV
jgi:hypothetical protein